MKSLKEIKEELIRDGAVQRLQDLNKEREILLKIINWKPSKQAEIIKDATAIRKKKHWTQTAAGRKKMSKIMKAKYDAGWKGKGANGRSHSQVH